MKDAKEIVRGIDRHRAALDQAFAELCEQFDGMITRGDGGRIIELRRQLLAGPEAIPPHSRAMVVTLALLALDTALDTIANQQRERLLGMGGANGT